MALSEERVAECPICGEPVRRNQSRVLTDAGLAHLPCTGRKIPPDPPPEGYEEGKRREERKLAALRADVARRLGKPELARKWEEKAQ